ncbi:MAG TPA: diguanylate cyclase [Solirubrobacteraceae bacterium]|jgi:diguanylate cyclase (GGDEF)-like protein|nr:diguanylate cyclase [Solirubrobacteraceae bacterium]
MSWRRCGGVEAMLSIDSRSRLLTVFLAAMGLAVAFHGLHALFDLGGSSLNGFTKDGVYTAIEVIAVGVCAARVLRRRDDRVAWALICAGLLAWTAGDLVWTVWLNNLASPPYPTVADAFYLAMYPAIYCGLVLLMRSHFRHVGVAVWLDGLVVGLTLAAIGADLILPAVHAAGKGSGAAVVINLSYLLCDLLLLVFLAVGFALAGWRPGRQWLLLALGTAVLGAADMMFLYQEAKGTYVVGRILDTLWPASMAILALASWQPRPQVRQRPVLGLPAVVVPIFFGLIALGLLVSATAHPLTVLEVGLATGALLAVGARATFTYFENARMLRHQTRAAVTDALTGLGNRRRLTGDLEGALRAGLDGRPSTLVFFDLDGFKRYNDSFGHGAGDVMLRRLGSALARATLGQGSAYRLGGDEFCLLLSGRFPRSDPLVARARSALAAQGSGFAVSASCGVVIVPEEAGTVTAALSVADERMYSDKGGERGTHSQTQSVLMQLLTEREPTLHDHVHDVGLLAVAIGRRFGLDSEELDELRRAAELHDIGKLAIPEEILHKSGPLTDGEQTFMQQHTIIGERILNVAPALRVVARLVRASHERWDGTGYPDHLAGEAIPLCSRIITACDAYDAMVSERAYQTPRSATEAIFELRRQAGTQFDPGVIEALCQHLQERPPAAVSVNGSGTPARAR